MLLFNDKFWMLLYFKLRNHLSRASREFVSKFFRHVFQLD